MANTCQHVFNADEVCNEPGDTEVLVKDRIGSYEVFLCRRCLAERNRKAAELRVKR